MNGIIMSTNGTARTSRSVYVDLFLYNGSGSYALTTTREQAESVLSDWKGWKTGGEPTDGRIVTVEALMDHVERRRESLTVDFEGIVAVGIQER